MKNQTNQNDSADRYDETKMRLKMNCVLYGWGDGA
jgi:hypothetical protein